LVGFVDTATITNTYSRGQVTNGDPASTGALIGSNGGGTVTQSFYDVTANAGLTGIGSTPDVVAQVEGKTTAQLQDIATFTAAGWDIVPDTSLNTVDTPRLAYGNGSQTIRLHKWMIDVPLPTVTYTLSPLSGTYVYNGTDYLLANLWSSSSIFGSSYSGWTLGTDYRFTYGGSTATSFRNAGSYSGIGINILNGYHVAGSGNTTGSLVIAAADTAVTANSDLTKTYNGTSQSVSGFTASVLFGSDTLAGLSAGVSGTNAGTYTSTFSGSNTNTNYNVTSLTPGSLVIAKANATVTANSDLTKTYTGQAQTVSGFTATGLVNSETESVLTGVTASGTGTNAADYTSTASGTDGNYNLSFVNGTLRIAKAHLTVTADNQNRLYGEANPTFSETISGFVNGETLSNSGVAGTATGSSTAVFNTAAGSAIIVASASGLSATNYDFSNLVDGVLTIVANVEPTTVDTTPPPPPNEVVLDPVLVEQPDTNLPVEIFDVSGFFGDSKNDVANSELGVEGISVSLVRAPSLDESGIISVSVPKDMATAGSGFSFPLPEQITVNAAANNIGVTLVNGKPLPTWLKFVPATKTFVATSVPDGAFPVQVLVTVGGKVSTIVISARVE
jgi:hypothetical protein